MEPIITSDKSHTLFNEIIGEHYHSTFGAVQESEHIFIDAGLKFISENKSTISILEMGFGTGLNALLTLKFSQVHKLNINYFGVEAFPISIEQAMMLNYPELVGIEKETFVKMHHCAKESEKISGNFVLNKSLAKLEDTNLPDNYFDLVYFDAFSPGSQPELWTEEVFQKVFKSMKTPSVLTTYSCKGIVKRALKSTGFQIEKLPGPPGKREFLRAKKC